MAEDEKKESKKEEEDKTPVKAEPKAKEEPETKPKKTAKKKAAPKEPKIEKETVAKKKPAAKKKVEKEDTDTEPAEEAVEDEEEEVEVEEEEIEIIEEEEEYKVKIKPDLNSKMKRKLRIRKEIKRKTPAFKRQEWFRYDRLGTSWRKPRGMHSKMRKHKGYRVNVVSVGYGAPKGSRNLHPSGFEEIMVYNPKDLDKIDPKSQAARIGHSVGTRKRIAIEETAQEKGIRVLNPRRV
jgi:large subunit ribosomal protein L32e